MKQPFLWSLAVLGLAVSLAGPARADYGGQGPITPHNPLIKAEIEHRGATMEVQAATEATSGHLPKDPHDFTIPITINAQVGATQRQPPLAQATPTPPQRR